MGIKLTGKATNVQHQLGVTTAEIELPKVRQEDLKEGQRVLVVGRIDSIRKVGHSVYGIIEKDYGNIVAILPEEVKEEVKHKCSDCGSEINEGEAKTFNVCDKCWDRHFDKVLESAVKTGIGIASVSPKEFFKEEVKEEKSCRNCQYSFDGKEMSCLGCKTRDRKYFYWKPKEAPKEVDFEALKLFKGYNSYDVEERFNKLVDIVSELYKERKNG